MNITAPTTADRRNPFPRRRAHRALSGSRFTMTTWLPMPQPSLKVCDGRLDSLFLSFVSNDCHFQETQIYAWVSCHVCRNLRHMKLGCTLLESAPRLYHRGIHRCVKCAARTLIFRPQQFGPYCWFRPGFGRRRYRAPSDSVGSISPGKFP